ncbi:TfoX/Sxy family protein [Stenotrophomonas sp. SY1]|uniref:TfoX/Sxy family protein n=1 Tax=Stenotrophomonas sp. SY1 TaxID=477235 RepID=UPI001E54DA02|nr:TfoX/Sxy family protein [Stenotrophomonas sp. SY1]
MSTTKLRNIGPKSAAWLRQVGLRSEQDLIDVGAVGAFMKVKRAGFKPSLNLLYSLEGALLGCHWQDVPEARRQQLVAEYEAVAGELTALRPAQVAGPVHETHMQVEADEEETGEIRFGED